jgi:hypothetical protein
VTFLEVLDDAVKIGLGGFGGWLIAKANRSHEFERERRRRKLDCLEAVMERLDDAEGAMTELCTASLTQKHFEHKPANLTIHEHETLLAGCMQDRTEHSKRASAAFYRLEHYRTKLIVFGFVECADKLLSYCTEATSLRVVVNETVDGQKTIDDYVSARENFRKLADSLRAMLRAGFAML